MVTSDGVLGHGAQVSQHRRALLAEVLSERLLPGEIGRDDGYD